MQDKITTLLIGASGAVGVEAVDSIPPERISQIIQTIIQVLIGIATIWRMFGKNIKKQSEAERNKQQGETNTIFFAIQFFYLISNYSTAVRGQKKAD